METSARTQNSEAGFKQQRLVKWMVDMFAGHVEKLMATRGEQAKRSNVAYVPREGQTSLDEVAEVIYLPRFDEKAHGFAGGTGQMTMSPKALSQLHSYVGTVANYYIDNPFHSFEHACHVTM